MLNIEEKKNRYTRQKREEENGENAPQYTHIHTHTHTHNHFTALVDFVRDYPGEPAPER